MQRKSAPKKSEVTTDRRGLMSCRVCGCTEDRACSNSCSWEGPSLCSTCGDAIDAMLAWLELAYRPRVAKLLAEVKKQSREAARLPGGKLTERQVRILRVSVEVQRTGSNLIELARQLRQGVLKPCRKQ